jgi:nicotinate-nucleotide adenylyltransferase
MWKNIDRIFNVCNFVVFNRPNVDKDFLMKEKLRIEKLYKKEIIFLDLKLIDISSSMIREMVRKNMVVDYFIPCGVYNTIQQLGLYK